MKSKIFLFIIFTIGVFLRFFMLGQNPPSLNWDEASTGYNAYSILLTGRDEYGTFLPLSIRSFDDYKPALYIYLTVPSVATFGLTDFAVRFPSALLGSLTIIVIYFLTKEIFKDKGFFEKNSETISLTASFLFAVSPWSLQFSRAAYEGNIGLFFLLSGLLFLLKFIEKPKYLFYAIPFLILSLYSYHSFRLIVPLFIVGFGMIYYKKLFQQKLFVIIALFIITICSLPIYSSFLFSAEGSGSRLSMVTIFGDSPELQKSIERLEYDHEIGNFLGYFFENRRVVYALAIVKGYLDHYNPDFLFLHGDGGRQHHPVDFGMLYLFSLPFILIGAYNLIRNFSKRIGLLFLLFIISPLASAVSTGAPHPVRAIIMAPLFDIFTAVGLIVVILWTTKVRFRLLNVRFSYMFIFLLLFCFSINFLYYINQYYIHTPREYGDFWQYGNKEAILYAKEHEDAYNNIIMSYQYDQPYIYYLYYNKVDPSWFQKNWNFTNTGVMPRFERIIGKYHFRNIDYKNDSKLQKTLLIGTPLEIPLDARVLFEIKFLDEKTAYKIVET